eukprot:2283731-Alexandrium_andersonii.AAC.1
MQAHATAAGISMPVFAYHVRSLQHVFQARSASTAPFAHHGWAECPTHHSGEHPCYVRQLQGTWIGSTCPCSISCCPCGEADTSSIALAKA